MYEDFERTMVDDGGKLLWFKITAKAKQWGVMSDYLFLVTIDRVMRRTTESIGMDLGGTA